MIKVDCITINTLPVKTTIDDHIQQLFDALLTSLRRSISSNLQSIDSFLTQAQQALSVRPQSVEEIGEVNQTHTELSKKKPEVRAPDFSVYYIHVCLYESACQ